jgi:hypothetical protein
MIRMLLPGLGFFCFCAAAAAQPVPAGEADPPALSRFTSPTLTRFASEEEFLAYGQAVQAAQRRRDRWGERVRRIRFAQAESGAQSTDPQEPVCTDPEICPEENDAAGSVTVTGSRISAPTNPSITNNQTSGVDEGDIVKQIGQFLIVLQDGRLFVIDTRPGGRRGIRLADRADVYRDARAGGWYDEMLVQGDRIVVTAYSYREGASEVSVFRLDAAGRVRREGVFLISSNDYYSATNYATRLVGDSLVVYTPYGIGGWGGTRGWPTVRRWLPEVERREAAARGVKLFDAERIYRPVRDILYPEIHTISVCPLGPAGEGRDLTCRTTAFVGPREAQLYVTDRHAYLWTNASPWDSGRRPRRRCSADDGVDHGDVVPATVYRVEVQDGSLEVLAARGRPIDQFSFLASGGRFHALLHVLGQDCRPSYREEPSLAFLGMPLTHFGATLREVPAGLYTPMPATDTYAIANRFTDRYVVYGSLTGGYFDPSDRESGYSFALPRVFAVPIERPRGVGRLAVPHNVLRAERVGDDIVLTGYRDRSGLRISLIDLDGNPRVASTALLRNRYESESRSHAFNSLVDQDGSGVMGLPTVFYDNSRPVWRSEASDLSYLTADRAGRLVPIGELTGEDQTRHPSYRCEVSCIDWYGNSRPIFTDGRVFALSGTELVEGRVSGGRIREIGRLDLSAPPGEPAR